MKMGDETGACWDMKNVPEKRSVGAQADEPAAQAYNPSPDRLWWKSEKPSPNPYSIQSRDSALEPTARLSQLVCN